MLPKRKYHITLFLIAIVVLITYNLVIKKSITLFASRYENSQSTYNQIQILNSKLLETNSALDLKYNSSEISYGEYRLNILSALSKICEGKDIEIIDIPETNPILYKNYEVSIDSITLKGNFFSLLNLLKSLEYSNSNSQITSAAFEVKKDLESKQSLLYLKIYILYIKPENVI